MSDQADYDDDDLDEDIGQLEPWPRMLQLTADLAVQPRKVAAVKRSSLNEEHCTVFLSGQSATDGGFVVERAFEDVLDEIDCALVGDDLPEPPSADSKDSNGDSPNATDSDPEDEAD